MSLSPEAKYIALVDALVERTADSSISWEGTSLDGVYATQLGNYTVHISEEGAGSSQDAIDIEIRIFNSDGYQIERFRDPEISAYSHSVSGNSYFKKMVDLHRAAGRSALGADKAIDNILNSLGVSLS